MINIYIRKIKNEEMTLEQVPTYWRVKVELEIAKH